MATRTYLRSGGAVSSCLPEQLAALIDSALSRTGTVCAVDQINVTVTHPLLTAADDATINAVIASYVFDPLFGLSAEARSLKGTVATLRQWSADADTSAGQLGTAVAAWVSSGTYTVAKDNVLKQTLQGLQTLTTRLGRLADRLADAITVQGEN